MCIVYFYVLSRFIKIHWFLDAAFVCDLDVSLGLELLYTIDAGVFTVSVSA